MLSKFFIIFNASLQNEFTYRLNFILWRFRNVLRLLMTYFLWRGIFVNSPQVFGYDQSQILTYILLTLIVVSIVLSSPSGERIGEEIANGDLSNYLVKPLNYLRYWFIRDVASKILNLSFNILELSLLFLWLRPIVNLPNNLISIFGFVYAISIAVGIYFLLNASLRFFAFWSPENIWSIAFLTFVFLETLSGAVFPLDILPKTVQIGLQFTPFPYLIYYPIAIFLGKIQGLEIIRILIQSTIWLFLIFRFAQFIWKKGLKTYGAYGK